MHLPYHSPSPQLSIKHCISQSYENLLLRQEAMNQARAGGVTKKLAKLTPVQNFQECYNRYTATTHCSVDFMDLVCHIDSMVMFCVFRFGVHVRVVCAFVWSLVWFFLFVCFRKEMRHWIYPTTYLEVHQGKIPELSKQRLICYTFVLPSLSALHSRLSLKN